MTQQRRRQARLDIDTDERFVLRLCATYLGRIMGRMRRLDGRTVAFFLWTIGERQMDVACRFLTTEVGARARARLQEELEDCDDLDDIAQAITRQLKKGPRRLTTAFVRHAQRALEERIRALSYRGKSTGERTMAQFQEMFDFSEKEAEYCYFVYLIGTWSRLNAFFEEHLECFHPIGRKYLAAALDVSSQELTRMVQGKILQLGIVRDEGLWHRLSDEFLPLLSGSPEQLFEQDQFRKVSGPVPPLEHHQVDPDKTRHIIDLLSAANNEQSTHVLLYGPPGTGKTSYARGIAGALALPVYEVLTQEDNRKASHRVSLLACLNMTNHGRGSVVIADEADNVLRTESSSSWFGLPGEHADKGWLNHLLDKPGVRMIWICNRVDGIDPSVRRRFAFSVGFSTFGRAQRIELWKTIARTHGVRRFLRQPDIERLARDYKLSAGAVELAVRSAKAVAVDSREHFLWAVRESLEAHDALLEGGRRQANKEALSDEFVLAALNVAPDAQALLGRLESADRSLRASEHRGRPGRRGPERRSPRGLNLLFHGPPGTGKSELARYLAHHLDREPVVRRASDIASKWVGETERNIAAAFEDAARDDGLLVLDEVDTFLFGREMAHHSWEISFTNELLTQMERFRGILVCTTNRLRALDPAALRRFQLKARFDYLTEPGKALLYRRLLAPLAGAPAKPRHLRTLATIGPLTPGDYRVALDRHAGTLRATHHDLLATLAEEAELRSAHRSQRPVGFGRA